MEIAVQPTPNPNARKFVLAGHRFPRPLNVNSAQEAAHHPLARSLLAIPGVYNVFMVQDFVTVNKLPDADWDGVEAAVRTTLQEHFT